MDITLEKVDKVRERTGVSYSKAKEALEVSNEMFRGNNIFRKTI